MKDQKELSTERMNFRFTPETLRKLKELAEVWDCNMTEVVERVIHNAHDDLMND